MISLLKTFQGWAGRDGDLDVSAAVSPLELFVFLGQTVGSRHFSLILSSLQLSVARIHALSSSLPPSLLHPDEFQNFVGKLPTHYAVNTSVVEHLWRSDGSLAQRYRQLESSSSQLLAKARHTANKLFRLSRRCRQQPRVALQRPR